VTALSSLLANLRDNAINYCDENCRIRVRCERLEKILLLAVDDSGPGLDADAREKATGRFYRAADTNAPGLVFRSSKRSRKAIMRRSNSTSPISVASRSGFDSI